MITQPGKSRVLFNVINEIIKDTHWKYMCPVSESTWID